ncbi:uncharacterized protein LOC128043047 [Gossypium raimondii]|uniref:uncharacterized protein LOC128043047 n=1 Tax=Gossypium raimondii TaxID=29730 RepID=UPI00227BE8BE|nr:uncharacterized protein LOC128043047 [Gossypium raimondii]
MKSRACFRCGAYNHYLRDCPEKVEKDTVQTSKPSSTATRGRSPHNPDNVSGSQGTTKDFTVKSEARTPARTYAIRACEDASVPDVITSTFSFIDTDVIALIDPGSTHSYICMNLASNKNLSVESTEFVVRLTQHDAVINCKQKYIMLKSQNSKMLCIESDNLDELSNVISVMLVQKYVRKRYDAYFAYVLDTKVSESKIKSVLVVCEYLDVFLEELPGLPPAREVEFSIDLILGITLISIAPYRMTSTELKELKTQLQELTDRGFCQLSFSA